MNSNNETMNVLSDLIEFESVTPDKSGCQKYIDNYLSKFGFETKYFMYGDVNNMIASLGKGNPCLAFIGHTDVVPPGELSLWKSNPYTLSHNDGLLTGRGTADMKGGIACFMTAVKDYVKNNKEINGSIRIILTADEEGDATNGIRKMVEEGVFQKNEIDYCLVGEPSSSDEIGDVIRNGRRGSITGHLTLFGIQGHVAYPEKADNPIHSSVKIISKFLDIKFDKGNEYFPPTSFQISNVNAGTGVDNVIPADIKIAFNIRYSTETSADEIKSKITDIIESEDIKYEITWKHSGEPFLTTDKEFMNICKKSIKSTANQDTIVSTNGGTSDGRFMAKVCNQVIELGLTNRSIHKINESIRADDLEKLKNIYQNILVNIFK
ncbi:MAG: succinyl-diaminopimelate desuccinylase [Gammaproteobacteria bacterium]